MLGFGLIGHAQGIVCEGSIIVLAQFIVQVLLDKEVAI